jgi:hypothetical protein
MVFEMVWEYSFASKGIQAPDKLYEVFSMTDHPRLPAVVLSDTGRLNSIASYFNHLVWRDTQ